MEFHVCTIEDLPVLRQVALTTFLDTFAHRNTAENIAIYQRQALSSERFRKELSDPHSSFFLGKIRGKAVGYIKLNEAPAQTDLHDPDSIELERIYLLSPYHGRGLGRTLMQYALDRAQNHGAKYLWLGVWEKNLSAIAFYEKLGFERFGEHDFLFGKEPQVDFLYRITLSA